jgi:hypothetical protein
MRVNVNGATLIVDTQNRGYHGATTSLLVSGGHLL